MQSEHPSYLDIDTTVESVHDDCNESIVDQEEFYGEILPAPEKNQEPKPLPKLDQKLVVPKKRNGNSKAKTPTNIQHRRPMKNRNFTSPLARRVGSLAESPIPDLSPVSVSGSPDRTPIKSPTAVRNFSSPRSFRSPRSFSSPIVTNKVPLQVRLNEAIGTPSKTNTRRDILHYKELLRDLERIKKCHDQPHDDALDEKIEQWQEVAKKASNYLLNEARNKITRMGGIDEYRRRQRESKLRKLKFQYDSTMLDRINDYMETSEYKSLDKYEKQQVKDRKQQIEAMGEKIAGGEFETEDDQDVDSEFSLKELYAQLQLDYDMIYKD